MAIYTFQQALKKQGVTAKDVKVVSEEVAQPKEQSFLQKLGFLYFILQSRGFGSI
jgi:hypothetical protein